MPSSPTLVTFKGGFCADVAVVARLIDLEARGARLELLPDGRLHVAPGGALTDEDRVFLRTRAIEARAVVAYSRELCEARPC